MLNFAKLTGSGAGFQRGHQSSCYLSWQMLNFAKLTGSGATATATPALFPSEQEQVC